MIAKVDIQAYGKAWEELDEAGWEELRSVLPDNHHNKDNKTKPTYGSFEFLIELDKLRDLVNFHKLEVRISNFDNNYMLVSEGSELSVRLRNLETKYSLVMEQIALGGKVMSIHVPNIGLIAFNEVAVLEDACTYDLQDRLDTGWRICAVCSPNGQRRPDYILGRFNPNKNYK